MIPDSGEGHVLCTSEEAGSLLVLRRERSRLELTQFPPSPPAAKTFSEAPRLEWGKRQGHGKERQGGREGEGLVWGHGHRVAARQASLLPPLDVKAFMITSQNSVPIPIKFVVVNTGAENKVAMSGWET